MELAISEAEAMLHCEGNYTAVVGLILPPASPYTVHGSISEIYLQHARTAEDKIRTARDAGRSCSQYEAARPEARAQGQKKARLGRFQFIKPLQKNFKDVPIGLGRER